MHPEWAAKTQVPFKNVLTRGKVVHGEVVEVRDNQVVLGNGQNVDFDYLLIGECRGGARQSHAWWR